MENKKKFVEKLGLILMMYSREKIIELKYIKDNSNDFLEIICTNYKKCINITGDSCIAIMNDVYKAMI